MASMPIETGGDGAGGGADALEDVTLEHFTAEFQKRAGYPPEGVAAEVYSSFDILVDAMKRAGSLEPAKVRDALAATKDSVSLRPRHGKVTVTDGPYAETKEQLGSYFLIEARDLNEAIQVASKHPAARLNEHLGWGVEVRPIEMCRVEVAAGKVGRRATPPPTARGRWSTPSTAPNRAAPSPR